jgi:hypothetical protein
VPHKLEAHVQKTPVVRTTISGYQTGGKKPSLEMLELQQESAEDNLGTSVKIINMFVTILTPFRKCFECSDFALPDLAILC